MNRFDPQAILRHLRGRQGDMTALLADLVQIESPTDAPEAQQPVFYRLASGLTDAGLEVHHLPGRLSGGQLYARPRNRRRGSPSQLLIGHTDTVWPVGTLEEMPAHVNDGRFYGPGAYDMKAGLVQIVFALQTLRAFDLEPDVTPVVFFNSDEETGSQESRPRIRRLARAAERTLVLEPSLGPEGHLKTARKGGGRFTITIAGRSAHAGLDPTGGASAIVELSHVIQILHALNDVERGISVNVGTIEGGSRPNVIAATGRAVVDVRVMTIADAEEIEERIRNIEPVTPGTTLHVTGGIGRPPMEHTPANRALWDLALEAAEHLGLDLGEATAGGASDGNETSLYSATLDGLGAVGDGAHAAHEHVELDRMPERTALLTLLLMADTLAPTVDASNPQQQAHFNSPEPQAPSRHIA